MQRSVRIEPEANDGIGHANANIGKSLKRGEADFDLERFSWFKGKALESFIEFPPMQRGASFNLDAVKAERQKRMQQAEAGAKGPGN